jgi:type IV pilus assembly protein PilC
LKQVLNDNELSVFSGQLAMILHSGISVLEGISIMRDDTPEGDGRKILDTINDSLEATGELAEALHATEVFPDYFIRMTEIRERSGTLEEVMESLSGYYDRQDGLMHSIRDALVYPLVLMAMLFAVLMVLMVRVMPVFAEVFDQLGIEMTGISATVFGISSAMQRISVGLIVVVIALVIGTLIGIRTVRGRQIFLNLAMHLPAVRTVSEQLACARFSNALALAIHSGLDMGESFTLAASLTQQPSFSRKTDQAGRLIEEGTEMADALRECGIITGLNARMMSIGFHTGSTEMALNRISTSCQEDADNRIQAAVSALEPTLTAILSVLTGLILISVMLPLLSVMASIG